MNTPTVQLQRNPRDKRWRWWIVSTNGKVLAKSETAYRDKCDAVHSLELVTGGEYQGYEYLEDGEIAEDPRLERGELRPLWVRESR